MEEKESATSPSDEGVLLLVDDNPTNLQVLHRILSGEGYRLLVAKDGESALRVAEQSRPSLVLLDIMMPPGIDGYEVCRRLMAKEETRDCGVIFLSALTDVEAKVKGLELGAVDYVSKPFEAPEVVARVRTHMTVRRLQRELVDRNGALERELRVAQDLMEDARDRMEGPLLGASPAVEALRGAVERYAQTAEPLLVAGVPGAGHEYVARAIHHRSNRRHRPFIYVDCLASRHAKKEELFGTGKGMVSWIRGRKPGKWDLADGGTLCLDRVEALPEGMQAELCERLSNGTQDAGGPDVRVIATSLVDPDPDATSSTTGLLSARLREQLRGTVVKVPALRERVDDIPVLVEQFVRQKAERLGRKVERLSKSSLKRLKTYSWPGNIDELRSIIECAVLNATGPEAEVDESLLEAGTRVGQYQLVEQIGAGAMGEVWLARHRLLVRPAAVKLIRQSAIADPQSRAKATSRFEREARATASLESPYTVQLYDFGVTDEGAFYYVMERLRGMDLATLLKEHGPLSVERVVYLLRQACGSLAEAHAAGLVHRDIKPANLFASKLGDEYDVLKVLDFGIVRGAELGADQVELTGANVVGTPAYLAPEIAFGKPDVDGRADLYSLACSAFHLLTGRFVFEADNPMAMVAHHATQPAPAPSSVTDNPIPAELEALIVQCLEKEPHQRIASAAELRARLEEVPLGERWTNGRAEAWWKEHGRLPE